MRLFLQYAASGVATGCAFALIATAFVAIYRVTLAVAGLGVGGEGAIVIDDNCTVSTVDKYQRLRQC